MKKIREQLIFILLPLLLMSCANAERAPTINQISADTLARQCPKSTTQKRVSFLFVVINKKGIAEDVLEPEIEVPFVDFKNPKTKLHSILKKGHGVRQKEIACWSAVVKVSSNPDRYKPTKQKIAVLWRPQQKIRFQYAVVEKIPERSPVDVGYKYTIATKASDPKDGSTYLDPRLVVKIRR